MLQLTSKDEYRGRITSVYTLVYAGTGPLGYVFAGATADRLGANMAFFLCGAAAIALIVLLNLSLSIKGKRKACGLPFWKGIRGKMWNSRVT